MSTPRKTFADRLDEWLQTAPEQEVRDGVIAFRNAAKWRRFSFTVVLKERQEAATPLLDAAEGARKHDPKGPA